MVIALEDLDVLVRSRAPEWYPELGRAEISVASTHRRDGKGVRLDHLTVNGEGVERLVIAKQYHEEGWAAAPTRPRLGLVDDRDRKPACEYTGLERLWSAGSSDPLVSPVRPLYYDDDRLLVMERFPGVAARDLMGGLDRRAASAFTAGGRALADLHRLPTPDPDRRVTGDTVDAVFGELVDHLSARGDRYASLTAWWKAQGGGDTVSLGAGHGDCSPRNLLVDDQGRVAWIDGLLRYRVPVYEDIATFTTNARVSARLAAGRGALDARHRRRLADAFVAGYAERAPVDAEVLRRFEVLVLLDRQASLLGSPRLSRRSRVLLALTDRELRILTSRT